MKEGDRPLARGAEQKRRERLTVETMQACGPAEAVHANVGRKFLALRGRQFCLHLTNATPLATGVKCTELLMFAMHLGR
jgi:hypothetical protein